jgi:hypothetical protein
VTFNNSAGGNFGTGINWSSGHHPIAGDTGDITSAFSGADYSVQVTDAEAAALINVGVANGALIVEAGGVLTVGSIDLTAGTLEVVSAGEITGGTTITDGSGTSTIFSDGTLDGVTWKGTLALTGVVQSSLLTITTSLNVLNTAGNGPGEIDVTGPGATVNIDSTMTLNGTTTNLLINIGTSGSQNEFLSVGSNDVLTFGSLVTVSQTAAGSDIWLTDVSTNGTLINHGTIALTSGAGSAAEINPNSFTNAGTINLTGGGGVSIAGESLDITALTAFSDTGVIAVSGFGRVGISGVAGTFDVSGTIAASDGSIIDLNTNASGTGTITLAGSSTADIFNYTGQVQFLDATGTLALEQPSLYAGAVAGMSVLAPGTADIIDLLHTSVTSIAPYSGNALGGTLTVMNGVDVAATIRLVGNYINAGFTMASDGNAGTDIFLVSCFVPGTNILTDRGEVAVEMLRVGDLAATRSGTGPEYKSIRWIGRRQVDLDSHPTAHLVAPIRIRAQAFGDGSPWRDVLLSPDHAVYVDRVFVPAHLLVNGTTITREAARGVVEYFHVELDAHDILVADGLSCESYLDIDDRAGFENGGSAVRRHPNAQRLAWETGACAPLIVTGSVLEAVRSRLLERAVRIDGPSQRSRSNAWAA